jgi:hypothetical protein
VTAIPSRSPRTTRLARALGLDGNLLRPATDRAMAWTRVGMAAAFLTGGPLAAISAGHWTYHAGTAEARAQAADRHNARAVLLQPTPPRSARPEPAGTIRPGLWPDGRALAPPSAPTRSSPPWARPPAAW